jgi:hypothetical protein
MTPPSSTYRRLRPHVRSGDLIAFESKSFSGRMIRAWSGSRYAHVGIAMWLSASGARPRLFLLESRGGYGVTMRLMSSAGPAWYIPTRIEWNADVNRFVWPLLGTAGYDWISVMRRCFFLPPRRNGVYYCSEFAGEILLRGGFNLPEEALADPGELVHAVLRNGPGQIFWMIPPTHEAHGQMKAVRPPTRQSPIPP